MLPPHQREAVVLVGAAGMSYEEAAEIAKCAVRAETYPAKPSNLTSCTQLSPTGGRPRWMGEHGTMNGLLPNIATYSCRL